MISFLSPVPLQQSARASVNPQVLSATERLLRAATWPLAILLVVHRVLVLAINGTQTDDFTTVYSALQRFLHNLPVYEQPYHHVDPLYLYNPGATALLSPLGMIGNFELARTLFILLNAGAIICALAILTTLVGHQLRGWLWPLSMCLGFASESVTNTLAFTNINGVLLLALTGFLLAFIRGNESQNSGLKILAGIILGISILIKPQFAPLIALLVVRKDWRATIGALAIPISINAIIVTTAESTAGYFDQLLPYLKTTRDYANSSWPGVQTYFQLNQFLYWAVWLFTALVVACTLLALIRFSQSDFILWTLTTSGVIFVGIFFLSSLGQQYYSMWLFPMMFSAVLKESVFKGWASWLAAALFLSPMTWYSSQWPDAGRWMSFFAGTLGWFILIAVSAGTTAAWWYRTTRARLS